MFTSIQYSIHSILPVEDHYIVKLIHIGIIHITIGKILLSMILLTYVVSKFLK